MLRVDLAIAGGGPAGAAAALAAARLGLRVAVLEAQVEPALKPGEWLAPGAAAVLHRLGVATRLGQCPETAVRSLGIRAAWGGLEPHHADAMRHPVGGGWLVERRRFEALLAQAAIEAGAVWLPGRPVGAAVRRGQSWRLAEGTGEPVECAILLDCTGRRAAVARRLGARVRSLGRQVAEVWWLARAGPPSAPWLTVEAVPDGWWYHAAAPGGREVAVRVADGLEASRGAGAPRPLDAPLIARALGERGALKVIGHAVCAAGAARLDRLSGDGWLAVGDAACAFDPVAAQGLPNALACGEAAALAVRERLDGVVGALDRCADRIAATHVHSLGLLPAHYAREARWPDRPFWRARQAGALAA